MNKSENCQLLFFRKAEKICRQGILTTRIISCAVARKITEDFDWDCKVEREYSETNLGCHVRVKSGLDWLFEQVDMAVILEDDILPLPKATLEACFQAMSSKILNRE